MVHSEVYVNKCGQHSAVLYTCLPRLLSKFNINIEKCYFWLFNFSSIFPEGRSADPICPYVKTPMFETNMPAERSAFQAVHMETVFWRWTLSAGVLDDCSR